MMRSIALAAAVTFAACWTGPLAGQEKPAEAKSSPEATRIYQDAANAQNGMAFEIAEEGWRKLLKDHPKDPLAAKAQHYLGVCLVQLKKPNQAAEAFQTVIKTYPKFELLEETLLNLASCQYSQAAGGKPELYTAAGDTFASLIKQFPKGKYVDQALYFQGESLYAQGKKAEAVAAYDQLVKDHPKSDRRADALYALGVAQEELSKFPEAGATYDVFLKEFATIPLATEVKMRKAETVLQAGDLAAAAKMFADAAAVKDFASADHAIFRQAYCVAKQDKFAEAGALYAKIPTEFAQSAYVADATIAAGRCFYKADKLDDAATWLGKAVERNDANSAEAAHWLCRILLKNKKPAEAADLAAKQVATGGEGPYLVNLKMDQADALYEIPDKRAESLALYAKLATDHPQHEVAPQALYNAAFAALELKSYDQAVKLAADFLKAYPQDKLLPDVKYVSAESLLQLKKYAEAEKAFADLIAGAKDHPDSDAWRVRLGSVAYLQKKYPETIAVLSPIVGSLKGSDAVAESQFLIGSSHFFTEKFADAEKALAASLAASPKWQRADETLVSLGRAQARQGKGDAAKASLARVVAEFPSSQLLDQAHYRLGELALAAGDFKSALVEYDVVATKWPQSPLAPYALFGRAMSRRQTGDAKGALEDLDAYLKTNPDQAHKSDAQLERGLAQTALNDHAGATKTFTELLAADPKFAAADRVLYELGWSLKSQEKHAEAVGHFARLAAEFADSPLAAEASFHVGEDRYEKKEFAEAVKAYTVAKAKAPPGELAEKGTYKLGWSHYQLKQFDEALKQFTDQLAAYGQGPLAADATFMKAECLFRLEKYQEAWPAYQTAAKTKASTPTIAVLTLLHGGQTASQLKQWAEAQKLLAEIQAKYPESPLLSEALYELGWAKQNAGQTAEALADYEAAAGKSRDHVGARARFMMGELYFQEKKYDEAAREFQRAMFGFGGEQATAETKNWQAKSGYEAGRIAEVQIAAAKDAAAKKKLIADAKRFYTFVVEKHAGHELAAEAKKRLEALSKL